MHLTPSTVTRGRRIVGMPVRHWPAAYCMVCGSIMVGSCRLSSSACKTVSSTVFPSNSGHTLHDCTSFSHSIMVGSTLISDSNSRLVGWSAMADPCRVSSSAFACDCWATSPVLIGCVHLFGLALSSCSTQTGCLFLML